MEECKDLATILLVETMKGEASVGVTVTSSLKTVKELLLGSVFFFVTSKSQFRRHAQKLKVKYFGGPLESFFFFSQSFLYFFMKMDITAVLYG